MKILAAIDTNILISAFFNMNSNPGKIISFVLDGKIIPLLHKEILKEYKEVSARKKFNFNQDEVKEIIDIFEKTGIFFEGIPVSTAAALPDPKDVVFYEVTLDARQTHEAYLVTGNAKHFPAEPFVVFPAQMVEIVEKESC